MSAEFSLNTQMFLLSKRDLWLSDGSMGFGEGSDAAFSEGNTHRYTFTHKHTQTYTNTDTYTHPNAQILNEWVCFLGSTIYGRVMVDPVQNLGESFSCSIEKVFLCTGTDGYVPKYSPTNKEYGCLADAPSLLHRFKILVWQPQLCASCSRSSPGSFVK